MNKIEKDLLANDYELSPSTELKDKIVARAQYALSEEPKKTKAFNFKFVMYPLLASFLLLTILGTYFSLRFEHFETIYLDINPSMSLTMNRFDRVVDYELLNDDSKELFNNKNFKNMTVNESIEYVFQVLDNNNKLDSNTYVNISCISKEEKKTESLLNKIQKLIDDYKEKNNKDFDYDQDKVTKDEVIESIFEGIGPLKKRLIDEILKLSPEQNFEELKNLSMKNLKDLFELLSK